MQLSVTLSGLLALLAPATSLAQPKDPSPTELIDRTGFPNVKYGRYDNKMICDGYINTAARAAGTKLFIASNTPEKVRALVQSAMAKHPKYSIVTDARQADFLLQFAEKTTVETRRWTTRETSTTGPKDNGTGDPTRDSGSTVEVYDVVHEKDFTVDTNIYSIYGIKHPDKGYGKGVFCTLFSENASKDRGMSGAFTGDPAKRLTKKLTKFFANPAADWLPEIRPATRAKIRAQGL
jgi:hypothetical protein